LSKNEIYKLALNFIPGVGINLAKNLIAYIGSLEGIFNEKKQNLTKIKGIGSILAENIVHSNAIENAEKELEFILKNDIKTYFYLDD